MYINLHGHVPCSQLAVPRLGSILYVDQEMDIRTFFVTQDREKSIDSVEGAAAHYLKQLGKDETMTYIANAGYVRS